MTKCKWLLEKDTFEENLDDLKQAIAEGGMEYKEIDYRPFLRTGLDMFSDDDCVLFYGSLNLSREIQRRSKWVPGSWYNQTNFECSFYYSRLGEFILNSRYVMLPYGEMMRQKDFLLETLGNNGCLFVRPSSGFKLFTGTLITAEKYAENVKFLGFYDVEPEKLVVVAEPRNLVEEWRLVVVGQRVVAASLYKENGQKKVAEGCPAEVWAFGEQVAAKWQPDPAWIMDICRTRQNELRLIEINSFSSSGLYLCDKRPIVAAAAELALKEWSEYHDS